MTKLPTDVIETDVTENDAVEVLDEDAMQARFETNMEAFHKHKLDMYQMLSAYEPSAEIIVDNNGELNVELAGTLLYGEKGARITAEEQLEAFRTNKSAYWSVQNAPSSNSLDEHSGPFFKSLMAETQERIPSFQNIPVFDTSYFLFLFGIGLAPHMDGFIQETECRYVLVIEPNLEFLYLSLKIYDWATLFTDFEEQERKINFLIFDDPQNLAREMRATIRNTNPLGIDRASIVEHYPNSFIQKTLKIFREKEGKLVLSGLGFFDDEMIMISNTYGNLVRGDALTMHPAKDRQTLPVLVVGGGPSIDLNAEFMIENQDNMIIVSCGSAIVPLLNYGIKPDFHVLLERDQLLLPLFQETAEEHDLSDIYIVASTTIPPGIGELFKKAIYFFRPGLSTFPMFCTAGHQVLPFPDPEVANAGLSFAQECGFRTFYFVGMDMGSKSSDHHHAKGAWAQTKGLGIRPNQTISIPGNFGGKILTNQTWMWTHNSLEHAVRIKAQGRTYFNLGDGAYIKGALPKRASTITVPPASTTKSIVVERLIDHFPPYTSEIFTAAWKRADLFNTIPKFCDDVLETLNTAENMDDRTYQTTLMTYLRPDSNRFAVPMIFRGTIYQMLASVEFFRTRVRDEEDRAFFDTTAKELFESHIRKVQDLAIQTMQDLVEKYD